MKMNEFTSFIRSFIVIDFPTALESIAPSELLWATLTKLNIFFIFQHSAFYNELEIYHEYF